MAEHGVTDEVADQVFAALAAFANFGFPESHSVSFAHLVYASSWLKLHYPAAFTAGLLNSQPMGFWSPQIPGGRCPPSWRRRTPAPREPLGGGGLVGGARAGWGRSGPGAATGTGLGARRGGDDGGADRGRAAVVRGGGPGAPGRGDAGAARDAGRCGCARCGGADATDGLPPPLALGGRRGGAGDPGPVARDCGGRRGPAPARADPVRRGGRRPVGPGAGARTHGHAPGPGAARGHGRGGGRRPPRVHRWRPGVRWPAW